MKKKIYKLALVTVILSFIFTLGACSKDTETADNTADNKEVESTTEKAPEYQKGTLTDTGFESPWMNLKFTTPENFIMSTEEDLQNLAAEDSTEVNADVYSYEMVSADATTGSNVMILIENLTLSNTTIPQYIENFKQQLLVEVPEFTFNSDLSTETLAGNEYTKLEGQATISGIECKQYDLFRKIGNKMIVIAISVLQDDSGNMYNTITNSFTPYN
jgi:hypothetical protein